MKYFFNSQIYLKKFSKELYYKRRTTGITPPTILFRPYGTHDTLYITLRITLPFRKGYGKGYG